MNLIANPVELALIASRLRANIIETSSRTGTPHLASCLSCVDLLTALYFSVLRINPKDPKNPDRDRFILSKGHGAMALFHVLALRGFSRRVNSFLTERMAVFLQSIRRRQITLRE